MHKSLKAFPRLPCEYDIREVPEELYLAVLAAGETRTEIRAEFSRMFARLRWPTKNPELGRGLLKD